MTTVVYYGIVYKSGMERVGRPALLSLFGCFHHGCQERNVPIWPTDTLAPEGLRPSAALLAEPLARQLGLRIWDVRFVKEGADWYLRVFIDRDGGVSIDDCVDLTRLLSPALDEADPIDQSYCLEVSSPGVERELTRPEHFEAYRGRAVTVRLIRPRDGQRDFTGRRLRARIRSGWRCRRGKRLPSPKKRFLRSARWTSMRMTTMNRTCPAV